MTPAEQRKLRAKLARIVALVLDAHDLLPEDEAADSGTLEELRTDLNVALSAARDAQELAGKL